MIIQWIAIKGKGGTWAEDKLHAEPYARPTNKVQVDEYIVRRNRRLSNGSVVMTLHSLPSASPAPRPSQSARS